MPNPGRETLYLIDTHGQIFRAYYAIRGGMNSPTTGEPTNAVFGFAGMLLKLFNMCKPHYVVMAIDMPGKTFRDELYPQYKAQRPPAPADLHAQEKRILEMARLFGIPIFGQTGAEADDIIATIVAKILADSSQASTGIDVRIVSKDKDLEQLLCDRVTMFDIHTDTMVDVAALLKNKGITPAQVIDVLTLMGDTVDNVPGVEGIGPKTAVQLIQEYKSVEGILANLDKIKGKRRENLEKAKDLLPLSRKLVTLKSDLEVDFDLSKARVGPIDEAAIRSMFETLGFRRHLNDLDRLLGRVAGTGAAAATIAGATDKAGSGGGALSVSAVTSHDTDKLRPRLTTDAALVSGTPLRDDTGFAASLFESEPEPAEFAPTAAAPVPAGMTTAADGNYRAITTTEQLQELVATLSKQTLIALDTETIGLGHRAPVCGLSLAWEPGSAVYIPLCSPRPREHLTPEAVLTALKPVFENPAIGKCGHNLKYDLLVLRNAGAEVYGVVFDSMIAGFLLNHSGLGLDDLAGTQLRHHMMQITQLIGLSAPGRRQQQKTMDQVELDLITRYAADDAEVSLRLYYKLESQLRILGMEKLAADVEMPLVEVLAEMEYHGIRVDPAVLQEQKEQLASRIVDLRREIQDQAGGEFNLDSPRQLAEVLFTRLGLPVQKRTKSGPSTDIEVLEKLADLDGLSPNQAAVLKLIVEYRQLTKLVGTYLDALRDSIHPPTGRVHAHFHQTGAATGRLSSSDPNLQNIPVRTEIGRQIRKAFVAEPGNLLISADYSQIELRVLAHLSQDAGLIAAFAAGQDIHSAVAAQVFNVDLAAVTREQRNNAKVINFGIVYGVTAYGLARRIEGLDVERAGKLIADYKSRFAGIGAFLDHCIMQAEELGYVTTMMGRRREIPQIRSPNNNQRNLGERLAINSVVQGSAADMMKLAMVNLHRRIAREKLPLKLLLQIHDELVLECPEKDAPAMAEIVKHEMETAMNLRVPLQVDAGIGLNWLAAK